MSDLPKMLSKREIELEELEEARYVQSLRDDIEKLQEQLNTAKKALTEITNTPESDNYFDCEECIVMMEESAKQALAAIGGDDESLDN